MREPISDLALHAAWKAVEAVKGAALAPAAWHKRIAAAQRRFPVLTELKKLPAGYPPSAAPQHDGPLLAAWHEKLLRNCRDADPWRECHAAAVKRQDILAKLSAAVEAGDPVAMTELSLEPCLEGYPFDESWIKRIEAARKDVLATRRLLAVLDGDDPRRLAAAFDARIVRRNPRAFRGRAEKLRAWLAAEVLPAAKVGLALPLGEPPLVAVEGAAGASCRVVWQWPEPRVCDRCVLAVCPVPPTGLVDPFELGTVAYRHQVDRRLCEEGYGAVLLPLDGNSAGAFVVVWAVIELGWETLYSEPFVLGQLEGGSARRGGPARRTSAWNALW